MIEKPDPYNPKYRIQSHGYEAYALDLSKWGDVLRARVAELERLRDSDQTSMSLALEERDSAKLSLENALEFLSEDDLTAFRLDRYLAKVAFSDAQERILAANEIDLQP